MGDSSAEIQSQKSPDGSENGDCIQSKSMQKAEQSVIYDIMGSELQ